MPKRVLKLLACFGVIGFVILYKIYNPKLFLFPKCIVYKTTGLYCTGCGSQRMLHALLNGHWLEAISQNVFAFTFVIALLFELIFYTTNFHSLRPFKLLNKYRYSSISVLVLILGFTVLRNIPVYPFTLLAPH